MGPCPCTCSWMGALFHPHLHTHLCTGLPYHGTLLLAHSFSPSLCSISDRVFDLCPMPLMTFVAVARVDIFLLFLLVLYPCLDLPGTLLHAFHLLLKSAHPQNSWFFFFLSFFLESFLVAMISRVIGLWVTLPWPDLPLETHTLPGTSGFSWLAGQH